MNTIDIICAKQKGFSHPQYQIIVDGKLFNDFLNQKTNSKDFDLLVPPIELFDEHEQRKVLDILDYRNVMLPLLVCSDDMDFSCTIVSTYVIEKDDFVIWEYFGYGLDMTKSIYVPRLSFFKDQYEAFTEKFKRFIKHPYSEFEQDI